MPPLGSERGLLELLILLKSLFDNIEIAAFDNNLTIVLGMVGLRNGLPYKHEY
jgi:hypothetical protein